MKKEERPSNELSNFSIDHILNRAGQNTCRTITPREKDDKYFPEVTRHEKLITEENVRRWHGLDQQRDFVLDGHRDNLTYQQYTFQWLNCTRYQPPRVQRIQKRECIKRRPGRHPRIPFTPVQIEILESSYKKCPYLNSEEIHRLSKILDLADARIKIWFQNRRAREKREKVGANHEEELIQVTEN